MKDYFKRVLKLRVPKEFVDITVNDMALFGKDIKYITYNKELAPYNIVINYTSGQVSSGHTYNIITMMARIVSNELYTTDKLRRHIFKNVESECITELFQDLTREQLLDHLKPLVRHPSKI